MIVSHSRNRLCYRVFYRTHCRKNTGYSQLLHAPPAPSLASAGHGDLCGNRKRMSRDFYRFSVGSRSPTKVGHMRCRAGDGGRATDDGIDKLYWLRGNQAFGEEAVWASDGDLCSRDRAPRPARAARAGDARSPGSAETRGRADFYPVNFEHLLTLFPFYLATIAHFRLSVFGDTPGLKLQVSPQPQVVVCATATKCLLFSHPPCAIALRLLR
ncbi:hypothetical protein EVAR_22966_1 [Eumeta japonica]|uniref:Uncharacterized protein n=1 Tax=Eumeta variegata TaxID=151549 RepID=A0A4C1UPW4_EUMVA|nr:hypothetical protein EVAR_22966_1 [Eumeta japonica]